MGVVRAISLCPPLRVTGCLATCLLLARCPGPGHPLAHPRTRPRTHAAMQPCRPYLSRGNSEAAGVRGNYRMGNVVLPPSPRPRARLGRCGELSGSGVGGCAVRGGRGQGLELGVVRWGGGAGEEEAQRHLRVSLRSWFCCGPVPSSEQGRSSRCLCAHQGGCLAGVRVRRALPELSCVVRPCAKRVGTATGPEQGEQREERDARGCDAAACQRVGARGDCRRVKGGQCASDWRAGSERR